MNGADIMAEERISEKHVELYRKHIIHCFYYH